MNFRFSLGGSAPPDPPKQADAALVWDYAATFLKFVKFWLKIVKIMTFAWRWEVGGRRWEVGGRR